MFRFEPKELENLIYLKELTVLKSYISLMKKILQSLLILITLLHLNACQQRHFGYLSKVKVKQNPSQNIAKEKKEISDKKETENSEAEIVEEIISAEADSTANLVGSTRNLIGKKPIETKGIKSSKENPIKRKYPINKKQYDSPNIPAYIALALSVLSSSGILLDLLIFDGGVFFLISMILAIPILILGIVGLNKYRREKARDGYVASIIAIVFGSLAILFFIILLIILLVFLTSGGFY